jgi:phage portal protein BeeE
VNRVQSLMRGSQRSVYPWGFENVLINGMQYPMTGLNQTLGREIENIDLGYTSLVYQAYAANAVVFACMRARMMLFTEARFGFQSMRSGRGSAFYGDYAQGTNSQLALLEHPWPGATTGDLLKYLITDADLAGNAFVARRGNRLVRLRPDWTRIVHGSNNPDGSMWDPDAELLGYAYQPGGPSYGQPWVFFGPTEVAHFAPIPDPLLPIRGMTWLSPILREIMGDQAATEHKLKFFEHGGTPNMVITTGYTDISKLREFMQFVRQEHSGVQNAYKMMGFTQGVDAKVVGSDLQQLDFKTVQGAGETRIASAAGVPPAVAQLSEGLQGSALNEGNFAAAMREFADLTMRPLWRNVAGSLERIIVPPSGSRLWYDDRDIPALKDDIKDAAQVQMLQSQALRQLLDGGFQADAALDAIVSGDLTRLRGQHTGLFSVQLQAPGSTHMPAGEAPGEKPVSGDTSAPVDIAPGDITTKPATPATNGRKPAAASAGRAFVELLVGEQQR